MANKDLGAAKKNKNDEFYTQLTDVEKEMKYYRKHFRDKVVFCNCDDPFESNFFKFFVLNFNRLKLKRLIATCYCSSSIIGTHLKYTTQTDGQMSFSFVGEEPETEPDEEKKPYKAIVNVVRDANNDGGIDMLDVVELFNTGENQLIELEGDGDFRSPECIELLDESDIVVTNPPFSLFREYIATLVEHDKKFVVIGNQNAITYKEIFPLLMNNQMWLGNNSGDMAFTVPDYYEPRETRYWQDETGQKWRSMGNICWFTNLDIRKRHEELILVKRYNEEDYPAYDNYDAINVNKTADIPCDFSGVMGVPITFMDKYNPDQFEIVGTISAPSDTDTLNLGIDYSEYVGYKQTGEKNGRTGSTFGKCPVIVMDDKKHPYYENKDGVRVQTTYHRIFVRNKHPEPRKDK